MTLAPVGRRLLSLVYEIVLLAALLFVASLLFWSIEHMVTESHPRLLLQLYLASISGAYFVWQWTHGGQTVPMKTWRLKLVARDGGAVSTPQALVRYLAAALGAVGIGFFWPLFDRDGQFLHDRIAGTRIVRT